MPQRKTPDVVNLPRVRAALERLDKAIAEHPELKSPEAQERLRRFLTSEAERPTKKRTRVVATRLTEEEVERLEGAAAALEQATPGLSVSIGSAARTAMLRGLALLEVELGLAKKRAGR